MLANMGAAEKKRFSLPMSKLARKLLVDIVKWSRGSVWVGANLKQTAQALSEHFDPILYEEAAHVYDVTKYIKLLEAKKIKNVQDYIAHIKLSNLQDEKWLRANSMQVKGARVGLVSSPRSIEVYKFLTEEFLLSDFNEAELNKLAYLGSEMFDLDIIRSEAKRIKDPDKRTVSYLYAIVRDKAIRQDTVRAKNEEVADQARAKLAGLFTIHANSMNKIVFSVSEDDIQYRKRLQVYLDAKESK
jgi:hypothetical protein